MGETGSGKTLLLRALVFLDSLKEGELFWCYKPVKELDIPKFRSEVIYLPQTASVFPGTVEDNLKLPFQFESFKNSSFDSNKVEELLGLVNRSEQFLKRNSIELSGGEKQIISLIRAIQLEPKVLLLDEPTASLDSKTTQLIEKLILNWYDKSNTKKAFVWVTHSEEQSLRIADRNLNIDQISRLEELPK